MNPVPASSPPFFVQPQRKADSSNVELSSKCYAYATLNALRLCDVNSGIADQAAADAFVKTLDNALGGGPARVLKALKLARPVAKNCENNLLRCAACAAPAPPAASDASASSSTPASALSVAVRPVVLPVVLATTVGGGNHWIYMTGMNADGSALFAVDQQNPTRGTLQFQAAAAPGGKTVVSATSGVATYTLNSIAVFVSDSTQVGALDACMR